MSAYKCIYTEINRVPGSADNGMLVERAQRFKTFNEAVNFGRNLRLTNANMVGKPVIDLVENDR